MLADEGKGVEVTRIEAVECSVLEENEREELHREAVNGSEVI